MPVAQNLSATDI